MALPQAPPFLTSTCRRHQRGMADTEVAACMPNAWEWLMLCTQLTPPLLSCRKLPPRLLGELITPDMRLVNTKFELQVDKWKFVGHPRKIPSFKDGEDTRALVFNIVFVLEVGRHCWGSFGGAEHAKLFPSLCVARCPAWETFACSVTNSLPGWGPVWTTRSVAVTT